MWKIWILESVTQKHGAGTFYYTYVTHIAAVSNKSVKTLVSFYVGETDPKLAGRPD